MIIELYSSLLSLSKLIYEDLFRFADKTLYEAMIDGRNQVKWSGWMSALDKKGMVELKPSEIDQRAIYVSLTQKSYEYFESKDNAGNLLLDKLFTNFSPAEIEQMAMLLGKVLQNAEICLKEN